MKKFIIPGIFHPLTVKLVNKKTLGPAKGSVVLGDYNHTDGIIRLDKDLSYHVKKHILYHELSHHIRDTLEDMKHEEDSCDTLGAYLIRLQEADEQIEAVLK